MPSDDELDAAARQAARAIARLLLALDVADNRTLYPDSDRIRRQRNAAAASRYHDLMNRLEDEE